MSFLLDTDICSAHLKGDRKVSGRLLQYSGRLHVSVLTIGELHAWALRSQAPPARVEVLLDFLSIMHVHDLDLQVARKYGELRAILLDEGRPAPSVDLFIAATALVHGLTVVTHNARHFRGVPELHVADWIDQ